MGRLASRTVASVLLLLVFALVGFVGSGSALAQEVFIRFGTVKTTSTSGSHSYSYGVSYFQGFGENLAWSVGYLNEGHVPQHKRDGLDFQG